MLMAIFPKGLSCEIESGISAVLFALYHPLKTGAGVLEIRRAAFFLLAGVYFGVLYVVRGFGIAVATHALYDIAVVVLLTDD